MAVDTAFIISRGLIVFPLMLLGLVGNSLILAVYIKDKTQAGRVFILMLALADLFGSVVVLPQTPFWELGTQSWTAFIFPQFLLTQITYVFITVAMALERVLAVFTPYKYKTYRRTMLKVMVAVAAVVIPYLFIGAILVFMRYSNDTDSSTKLQAHVYYTSYLFCVATGLLVVMVAYPAIAIKLYRQHRQIRRVNTTAVFNVTKRKVVATTSSQNQQQENTTTKHVKALKLYLAILALYLASFIPMTLILTLENFVLAYGPFLNHVGNVFIYYVMIKSFRMQSKEVFLKTFSKWFVV